MPTQNTSAPRDASPLAATASTASPSESRLRKYWLALGLAFLAFAWYGSLVPFHRNEFTLAEAWQRFTNLPIDFINGSKIDWGVNALLLVPAGFCLLGAVWRSDARFAQHVLWTLLVAAGCFAVSFSIEFSQSWFPPRIPSRADVVAQFLGAAAGIAAWWLCGRPFNRALADVLSNKPSSRPLDLLLVAYVAGLIFFSIAPLDLTIRPGELWDKYRSGRIVLVPFASTSGSPLKLLYDVATDGLLFLPVGVFAATFPGSQSNVRRSVAKSFFIGGLVVVGIEIAQLLVLSRFTDVTDVITGMAGVALGVLAYRYVAGKQAETATPVAVVRTRLILVGLAYIMLLLAVLWAPYNFTVADTGQIRHRLSIFFSMPLSRALEGDYFSALNGFLEKFLLFAPVGAWIAFFTATVRPNLRFVANLALLATAAALAMGIEFGQILLPSRFASFDDVMICTIGTVLGFWITNLIRPAASVTRATHQT